jgi:hypothetical protein
VGDGGGELSSLGETRTQESVGSAKVTYSSGELLTEESA